MISIKYHITLSSSPNHNTVTVPNINFGFNRSERRTCKINFLTVKEVSNPNSTIEHPTKVKLEIIILISKIVST
jgi:hypothetical protein